MSTFLNLGQTDGFGVAGRENDRAGRMREVFLSDGNSAIVEATDPYGFWIIKWKSGKTPGDLIDQSFTSANQAIQYLTNWLDQNRYDTKISKTKVEIPVVETKKVKVNAA